MLDPDILGVDEIEERAGRIRGTERVVDTVPNAVALLLNTLIRFTGALPAQAWKTAIEFLISLCWNVTSWTIDQGAVPS